MASSQGKGRLMGGNHGFLWLLLKEKEGLMGGNHGFLW